MLWSKKSDRELKQQNLAISEYIYSALADM